MKVNIEKPMRKFKKMLQVLIDFDPEFLSTDKKIHLRNHKDAVEVEWKNTVRGKGKIELYNAIGGYEIFSFPNDFIAKRRITVKKLKHNSILLTISSELDDDVKIKDAIKKYNCFSYAHYNCEKVKLEIKSQEQLLSMLGVYYYKFLKKQNEFTAWEKKDAVDLNDTELSDDEVKALDDFLK